MPSCIFDSLFRSWIDVAAAAAKAVARLLIWCMVLPSPPFPFPSFPLPLPHPNSAMMPQTHFEDILRQGNVSGGNVFVPLVQWVNIVVTGVNL